MVKKIILADKWNRDYITITEYKNGTAKVYWDSTGEEDHMGKKAYKRFRKALRDEGIWKTVSIVKKTYKRKR